MGKSKLVDNNKGRRIDFIDSLRGISCICVFLNHFVCIFYPGFMFANSINSRLGYIWLSTPLNAVTNGNTPVQFFFVISGLLITMKIYNNSDYNISAKLLVQKFMKIFYITSPAIIFSFILMKLRLMYHLEAAGMNGTLKFVTAYNNFNPGTLSCGKDLISVLFTNHSYYNAPLGTMSFELLGGYLIIFIAYSIHNSINMTTEKKTRGGIIYLLISLLLMQKNQNLCSFLWGGGVYHIYFTNIQQNDSLSKKTNQYIFEVIYILLAIYFMTVQPDGIGIYWILKPIIKYAPACRGAGISMLLLLLLKRAGMQRKLENRLLMNIGKLSPYIYMFHWPILLSLGCFLYIRLGTCNYFLATILILIFCWTAVFFMAKTYAFLIINIKRKGLFIYEQIKNYR